MTFVWFVIWLIADNVGGQAAAASRQRLDRTRSSPSRSTWARTARAAAAPPDAELRDGDPFAELTKLRSRFDRMLEDVGDGHAREWTPAVDLIRENGHLVVRADVPGIKPEDISIEVEHGVLSLTGKHEETDERLVRRERRYGAFSRRMPLPEGIDPKKIKAVTRDGVARGDHPAAEGTGRRARAR